MPALAITIAVAVLWWLQGIGFVRWLLPALREQPIVEIAIATWFGAMASLVLGLELYYVVPGATLKQLAWPITLVLAAVSIGLFARSPRGPRRFDATSIGVLGFAVIGTLLVLRPLLGASHLAYYSQNNGEFANYAVLADMAKFHDASTDVGFVGLRSREAVAGFHTSLVSSLTGISTFWVIQPIAAAYALLAFGALGVAFRKITIVYSAGPRLLIALGLLLGWAEWSSTSQCFFTLSFISQYVCVALWFGALALTLEIPLGRARIVVLGITFAALACTYPEMTVPSIGVLGLVELARAPRRSTVVALALAVALSIVIANRLGYELVVARGGMSGGGWNIFGNHDQPLKFFSAIAGLANPFTATTAHALIAWLAVAVFVAALALSIRDARRSELRPIPVAAIAFALGIIEIFVLVARRGDHTNYIALKLLLNFHWLAYLAVAATLAARPKLVLGAVVVLAVIGFDVSRSAYRFTKLQRQATRTALYDRADADAIRAVLDDRPYIAASWFDTYDIGAFLVYDEDLFMQLGGWPDVGHQPLPAKWVLLVNHFDPATDARLSGRPLVPVVWWTHHALLGRTWQP